MFKSIYASELKRYYDLRHKTLSESAIKHEACYLMHMAHSNGRLCGAKRPKCEAERSHHL